MSHRLLPAFIALGLRRAPATPPVQLIQGDHGLVLRLGGLPADRDLREPPCAHSASTFTIVDQRPTAPTA